MTSRFTFYHLISRLVHALPPRAAATGTGAYFSDSRSGGVTGSTGSIKVVTAGGGGTDNLNFTFNDMLPGERQTATATYLNTGKNKQDVWLVFPNADALHALNDLGRFGEAHVSSNGTEVLASTNLNDNSTSCPAGTADCNPLPSKIKLGDNVAPGLGGSVSFSFAYGARLRGAAAEEGPFNCYPLGSCTSNGLPFQVVATQHGIAPDDVNNTPGNIGPGH